MGKKLQNLLTKQSDLRDRMAQSVSDLEELGAANITLEAAETVVGLLDGLWAKFEAQHELIIEHLEDAFAESEYNSTRVANSARVTYITQRSLLLNHVRKLKVKEPSSASKTEGNESSGKPSLPRLKISSFSGAFEDWPTFRDLFQSIVGSNSSLSAIEKFHYLKTCLEGPAKELLIQPLAMTEDYYPRAWELLSERY